MSFRRRHRWTRRFLFGLAFAVMVAPAQARQAESIDFEGRSSSEVTSPPVISYLSHGMTAADVTPPVISYLSHGMTAADALDPRTGIPLSAGIPVPGDPFIADTPTYTVKHGQSWYLTTDPNPVRPDDRGDRFVVGDGTPATPVTDGDGFTVSWENGTPVGIGALALVLALALVVANRRRPRIAL